MGSIKKATTCHVECKYKCIGCEMTTPKEPIKHVLDIGKTIKSILPGCHPQANFKPFVLVA